MLINAYILIILMFLNLNFMHINIPVHVLNYSTRSVYCLLSTNGLLQHVNDVQNSYLRFMQYYLILHSLMMIPCGLKHVRTPSVIK
jgi:hypothetical protein